MDQSEDKKDVFKLSRDWLSVQEVVDAVTSPACGAVSLFIGTTREDQVDGRKVIGLEYEAYEPMAQSEFRKLCDDVRARWPSVKHVCVYHRLGWVEVGQASIVMAISSPHRHDGQQAMQHAMTELKAKLPVWKKEVYNTQDSSWKQNVECSWSSHRQLPVSSESRPSDKQETK
ncbi:molybdopterin synthase catalytic subunit [Cheilinus undulatus]|uniref:molybdopterin synthase catalytic subunit n=1 Tax=Cheilinus undulatus TaxID=241271 RepID=UPI001BD6A01D|nr:molybdopterin synthase catalytic subunit [Cheilinus undulatus]XP_041667261.1 molybdopterin synthase catalytic subunit [Cheilinus undulatus]XP_041667262.1 molybdopterin synthase catalytic subunit [Cheilinus undulatus]XP_041667264.1 molybdopterin synthase catalytic subunit [Cheilinus undulatus]XP_041667265.1 molybdopterin synthase catalytic subunit [Cheilinus undulatus]XP_041667266.1 molybdopterin synthase catalytic subunit [Cheilinus undulatus]